MCIRDRYINDNPLSKTSTVYTGRNKVKALSVNNIAERIIVYILCNKRPL